MSILRVATTEAKTEIENLLSLVDPMQSAGQNKKNAQIDPIKRSSQMI